MRGFCLNSNLSKEIQCTGVGGRDTSFEFTIPYTNSVIAICVYDNNTGSPTCVCSNSNVTLIGSHKNGKSNCFVFRASGLAGTSVTFTFNNIGSSPMYVCEAFDGTATKIDTTLTESGTLSGIYGIIFWMRDVGSSKYPAITYSTSCITICSACRYESSNGHYNRSMWIEVIKLHTDDIVVNLISAENSACIGLN